MFTIKHCHSFREDLYHSVEEVTADMNLANLNAGVTFRRLGVFHILPHAEAKGIPAGDPTGGTVFIMNDNGKTVARYDLGPSSMPPNDARVEPRV